MSESATYQKPDTYRSSNAQQVGELQPTADLIEYVTTYAREQPKVAALWCLGVGFILGWKLKPW